MAKVLLVEDDNNLREIYQARLAAEGYEISSAQDGEEALVVAKQTRPDLVVSDVMMPKISGFEMLDILRNTPGLENVKVIMLTALGQSEDRDRADSLGADKYLVKSQVTLEDIVKTAHELLGEDAPAPAPTAVATTEFPAPTQADPSTTPEATAEPVQPAPAPDVAEPAEPVAVAPVEAPAADPLAQAAEELVAPDATAPQPTPVEPTVLSDTAQSGGGSTEQEEALVSQQIDDFVQSAPAEPVAAPEPVAAQNPTDNAATDTDVTASTAAADAAAAADDQLMADAVDELADNNPATASVDAAADETTEAEPAPETVVQAPDETEVSTDPEPSGTEPVVTPEEVAEDKDEADKTNIAISGKKVIQPLDSEPKPDIHELLAKEEAKASVTAEPIVGSAVEGETAQPAEPTEPPTIVHQPGQSFTPQPESVQEAPAPEAPVEDLPSGAPAAAPNEQKEGGIDPNSIAL